MSAPRPTRRRILGTAAAGLALAGAALVTTSAPATAAGSAVGTAHLSGSQQVPANGSSASGYFRYVVRGDQICYALSVRGLSAPAAAGHIHVGAAGTNGPVVLPLKVKAATSFSTSDCVNAPGLAESIAADPAGYYVNVHNAVYPGGEIRGQLVGLR